MYSVAMLHCASKAVVVRPLAFDAGVLPDSGTGAGAAQIQGVVCEPSSTGPPIGWLVMTMLVVLPGAWTVKRFCPTLKPVTNPMIRPLARSASVPSGTGVPSMNA